MFFGLQSDARSFINCHYVLFLLCGICCHCDFENTSDNNLSLMRIGSRFLVRIRIIVVCCMLLIWNLLYALRIQ